MARYRKIDVRLWIDERFRRLSPIPPCGQGLWLYLLTNPDTTNIPGLFRAGESAMAEALGWPLEAFREAFAEAFREGMVKADWKARVVWIPKAIAYHRPESPNVVLGWSVSWDEIPDCSLKHEAYHHLKAFVEGLSKGFVEAFAEACRQPSRNQEQEQEQEQEQKEEKKSQPARATRSLPSSWSLECARLLGHLLRTSGKDGGVVPGARFARGWEQRWAREIEALTREAPDLSGNGKSPAEHIEGAIRWALGPENLGCEYEVVIRSGRSLREKWSKLVNAHERQRKRSGEMEGLLQWMQS